MAFMTAFELVVSFIQAYVFTMLSATFIGLAQAQPHHNESQIKE
jgi:F-type H+-transporting ATPase subunit a